MKNLRISICAAAAAACFYVAGSAQAGLVYQGDFDPPLYGGTVFVDVDPLCVLGTGWISASCGTIDILSLVVNNHPSQPVDQLTFAPPTISNAVTGLYWLGGVLSAIDTILISPQVSGPTTGDLFTGSEYAIQFVSNQAPNGNPQLAPVTVLFECLDGCGILDPVGGIRNPATQQPFVRVPEPGSLALMLGALGAAWLARRRKTTA